MDVDKRARVEADAAHQELPQGVILFTEPHSELNAGLVVVCASQHSPIMDLSGLDLPVVDSDAHADVLPWILGPYAGLH